MNFVSSLIIPVVLTSVILFALLKKVPVYDSFLDGAKNGFSACVNIIVPLVGLLSAISMFRASGAMEFICNILKPLTSKAGFPKEVLPLALIKPISGSGALAAVGDIFKNFGTDNFIGNVASVVAGSTETTFYTLAVYFGSVGIKDIRYTAKVSLVADIVGFAVSAFVVKIFLGF